MAQAPLTHSPVFLTRQVKDFLRSHYDFRYNLLTEETEFRRFSQRDSSFLPIGKRELNTFCMEAHQEGVNCWDKDLQRYIYSTEVESYHPFRLYMDELPIWDGHGTSKFISTEQGCHKSTLVEMGLLNMDEFDKYGPQKMPLLKNLMQMSRLNICKAYQKNFRSLPRIASFIGTSNRTDLLCDSTGSQRFICVEVEHDIDCTDIEYSQISAQLKSELQAGVRHWLSKDEERDLQRHNAAYYHVNPVEDILRSLYAPAI